MIDDVEKKDIADLIVDRPEFAVVSSNTGVPREEDVNIEIERVQGHAHCFYFACVCPLDEIMDGGIHWRIESFLRNQQTEYRLYMTNLSTRDVKVSIKIYKLAE